MAVSGEAAGDLWWDYGGYTRAGYCGQGADLLAHELEFAMNAPGLVPIWESERADYQAYERFWLRCPLKPGHDGPHGAYLGTRRWNSLDVWYPGDSDVFDTQSREWYVVWGPERRDRRVVGPMARCGGRQSGSDRGVEGVWACPLWSKHPGGCALYFSETVDYDYELSEMGADEAADLEVEVARWQEAEVRRAVSDYLSGDASQREMAEGYDLSPEEVRELVATRTTAEERGEARRRRNRKLQAHQRALAAMWASEWTRREAAWGRT